MFNNAVVIVRQFYKRRRYERQRYDKITVKKQSTQTK